MDAEQREMEKGRRSVESNKMKVVETVQGGQMEMKF